MFKTAVIPQMHLGAKVCNEYMKGLEVKHVESVDSLVCIDGTISWYFADKRNKQLCL
jgi:hypothetical protein